MTLKYLKRNFSSKPITKSIEIFSQYQKIQFDPEFLTACALAEKGKALILALYEKDRLLIAQPVIKRRIPGEPNLYDLISPFEYGTIFSAPETKETDWQIFTKSKQKYCRSQSIITEFYRHSPGDDNLSDQAKCIDHHVYLDLGMEKVELLATWKNSLKWAIRKSFRYEITCRVSKNDSDINTFIELYSSLMKKHQARQFYYFSPEYFKTLLKNCRNSWLFILETNSAVPIAASIVVGCGDSYYQMLTASDSQHLTYRPNERLIFEIFNFCKKKEGAKRLILGGGGTGVKNFKSRFSKLTLPYFISCNIYSKKLYTELCNKKGACVSSDYFPAYRI